MPAQKNWVPSVVMNDGMPTLAMMTPLRNPTRIPDARPAMTAIQPRSYSLNSTAKTKPEKAMIEGKERSISPRADHEREAGREKDERRQGGKEGRVDVGREENLRRPIHEEQEQQDENDDDRQGLEALQDRRA